MSGRKKNIAYYVVQGTGPGAMVTECAHMRRALQDANRLHRVYPDLKILIRMVVQCGDQTTRHAI